MEGTRDLLAGTKAVLGRGGAADTAAAMRSVTSCSVKGVELTEAE